MEQFGNPAGVLGRLAGFIMRARPSNRERSERSLALLDVQPTDHVLEIGFGPGLAIARAAELANRGKVVGVDHSELMLRQARRLNQTAINDGRVELRLGSAALLPGLGTSFHKVLAINVFMFWDDPTAVLRGVRGVMNPGGMIALTLQPRNRGATDADARDAADRMADSLRGAGFESVRVTLLEMAPVSAACVLASA